MKLKSKLKSKDDYLRFNEYQFFVKKYNSIFLNFEILQDVLNEKELKKFDECATYLKYAVFKKDETYQKKLIRANFCKNKFCSVCSWRRSLKYRNILLNKLESLDNNKDYIFLTLTTKNFHYLDFKEELSKILQAFNKLFRYLYRSNDSFLGHFRTLEFTFQHNNKEFINLHIHTFIVVKKAYFSNKFYIKQKDFIKLWKKYLNVDYDPIVDIRRVRPKYKNSKKQYESALFEVTKYVTKTYKFDQFSKNPFILKSIYNSLKGVRLFGFGGILHNKKAQKNSDNEDLVNIFDRNEDLGEFVCNVEYCLSDNGFYDIISKKKELN